jgi:hypothetical protein
MIFTGAPCTEPRIYTNDISIEMEGLKCFTFFLQQIYQNWNYLNLVSTHKNIINVSPIIFKLSKN